ncbi:MAG TPA: hypothetical protein VK481_06635 [Gemmatimonadaceae bacterium]|jgi:hypothetical protein|nr:hypothetical protein [Gemmatimonadaceae bacterium]
MRAASRGIQGRDKASSIPTDLKRVGLISPVSARAYEFGGTPPSEIIHDFVAVLPHSCGGRTTIELQVSSVGVYGERKVWEQSFARWSFASF